MLFITSLDDEQSLVKCLESGGDDFISKPFEKIILHAKVKAHERTRRLSLEIQDKNQSLTYFQLEVERNHHIVEHIFDNAIGRNPITTDYFDFYTQPEAQFNVDLFCVSKARRAAFICLSVILPAMVWRRRLALYRWPSCLRR
ncbi:MAG TPA: hypothetical protein DGF36_08580 [Alteromonas sp.]|nr:hypothetical protein [Alteromonas sp.]HCB08033.1 hypothetical protein [Alteromonas sp.]HCL11500.1 hypothetical protein [Alteromonas sp.]HCV18162.1 hypothetical protein [Alteromonas sp.]